MMFAQTILKLLKDYVENVQGGSYTKAAATLGINPHTLRKWMLGERTPTLNDLGKALDVIGIRAVAPNEEEAAFDFIPKVCAKAGAGSSLITSAKTESLYAFRRDFLRGRGISAPHAVMLDVMGPSMEPMILDGDTILIDTRDLEPRDGKIYLVGFGEDLLVKRLQRAPHGWILNSENSSYSDIPVEGEDLNGLRIYGRVRWFGRTL